MTENEVLDLETQEVSKLDRIDTNKINIIINENEFVIPYGIKYNMVVKQPDNALSKMKGAVPSSKYIVFMTRL